MTGRINLRPIEIDLKNKPVLQCFGVSLRLKSLKVLLLLLVLVLLVSFVLFVVQVGIILKHSEQ